MALYVQFWAPDDGRKNCLKHVERLTEINKLWNVASCWLYSVNILALHGPMNVKSREGVEICLYDFFNLETRWLLVVNATSRPLYPREILGTHYTGGWVGPRVGLDGRGKSRPPPGFDPRTVQLVASRYFCSGNISSGFHSYALWRGLCL